VAVSVGVGPGSDADAPEPDPLGRPSAGDPSEESEEHDVRAAKTTATATTAVDDVLRIMAAIEPRHDRIRADLEVRYASEGTEWQAGVEPELEP
jgi:hypothetical protein